jgi:hypothetical protein
VSIPVFIERWEAGKAEVLRKFSEKHPADYDEIVKAVIECVTVEDYDEFRPDPERIHKIDDGDYQGTLLFVVAEKGYQPSVYYYVAVGYGSCSGCDTLQGISNYSSEPPTAEQAAEYLTLAMFVVQVLNRTE